MVHAHIGLDCSIGSVPEIKIDWFGLETSVKSPKPEGPRIEIYGTVQQRAPSSGEL